MEPATMTTIPLADDAASPYKEEIKHLPKAAVHFLFQY